MEQKREEIAERNEPWRRGNRKEERTTRGKQQQAGRSSKGEGVEIGWGRKTEEAARVKGLK
jgi:hypothetical protein